MISFSFRRARYNMGYVPDWPNVELGKTTERRLAARILTCLRALWVINRERRTWREASMLYVRNLDLALLALAARMLTGSRAPMVYEVLDVHPSLTRPGARGAVLRWLERQVLKCSELLVVSSPAFLRNFFRPLQGYQGQAFLLENKWPREGVWVERRKVPYELAHPTPIWTIGWFGNLRCRGSLDFLTSLADALPDRVRIYMRGCASLIGEQSVLDAVRGRENMVYEGEYKAPEELPLIYSRVHFNWCADLSEGDNSVWLLPNRIYEGGYFGIPAIAIAAHETGRIVRERQLGISLEDPVANNLKDILLNMTCEEYRRLRGNVETKPDSSFVDNGELARLVSAMPSAR
jgi:succinoglycan biosynthesis protein ExoL